jgi:hypothetical protein
MGGKEVAAFRADCSKCTVFVFKVCFHMFIFTKIGQAVKGKETAVISINKD